MDRTVADTIDKMLDSLRDATLITDRRDACRNLRSCSKDYRVEVGAQGMEDLVQAIRTDHHDPDILNYCLESLNYIISGPSADSPAATWDDLWQDQKDPGRELAEIFLKKHDNVHIILDFVNHNDFKTRWVAVRLIYGLARQKLPSLQDSILSFPTGVSRLMELLSDEQEVIRNDALVLFGRLTQSNSSLQHIVAYENGFEKIMYIIGHENYFDGTIAIVKDCLSILLNLLQCNEPNQILFREASHIQKLMPFFDAIQTINWNERTNEEASCLVLVLKIIDSMILVTNSPAHVQTCQNVMQRCGLLDKLCVLLTSSSMPIGVLSETMNTASDIVRGHLGPNANVVMPTNAMMPVMLLSMVKEICQNQEHKIAEIYDYMHKLHDYVKCGK